MARCDSAHSLLGGRWDVVVDDGRGRVGQGARSEGGRIAREPVVGIAPAQDVVVGVGRRVLISGFNAVMRGEELRAYRRAIERLAWLAEGGDCPCGHAADEDECDDGDASQRGSRSGNRAQSQSHGECERRSEYAEDSPRELQEGELRQMIPERKRDGCEQERYTESQRGEYGQWSYRLVAGVAA